MIGGHEFVVFNIHVYSKGVHEQVFLGVRFGKDEGLDVGNVLLGNRVGKAECVLLGRKVGADEGSTNGDVLGVTIGTVLGEGESKGGKGEHVSFRGVFPDF